MAYDFTSGTVFKAPLGASVCPRAFAQTPLHSFINSMHRPAILRDP